MDNGGEFTTRLLKDSGITPGQSALDVGCGSGDVTFRLAEHVGPSGHVIGIDLKEQALQAARDRAKAGGITNIAFVRADVYDLPPPPTDAGFDIVTVRRVLMYLPDKVRAVRAMLDALCPGGRLFVQEHDGSLMSHNDRLPLNMQAHKLIWDTVEAEGADIALGLKLHGILIDAGAIQPEIRAEAVVQTADQSAPTAMIIEAMTDRIVASGIATRDEISALNVSSLHDRLSEERRAAAASFIAETIFGALAFKA